MADIDTIEKQEQEEEQLSIVHSPAAIVTIIFLSLMFTGAVAFFGYQTWQFVNWLFPQEALTMKWLAVVNFDAFSYVWLAVGLFLARWIQPLTRTLAVLAGIVDFLLSLGCSVIQIMIVSAERLGVNTDPNLVYIADMFIIVALVWNISTLMGLIHIQWPYIINYHPPKKLKKQGRGWFNRKNSTPVQSPSQEIDYDKLARAMQSLQQSQPSSPLQQPPLPSQASQSGSQNGVH